MGQFFRLSQALRTHQMLSRDSFSLFNGTESQIPLLFTAVFALQGYAAPRPQNREPASGFQAKCEDHRLWGGEASRRPCRDDGNVWFDWLDGSRGGFGFGLGRIILSYQVKTNHLELLL